MRTPGSEVISWSQVQVSATHGAVAPFTAASVAVLARTRADRPAMDSAKARYPSGRTSAIRRIFLDSLQTRPNTERDARSSVTRIRNADSARATMPLNASWTARRMPTLGSCSCRIRLHLPGHGRRRLTGGLGVVLRNGDWCVQARSDRT